MKWKVCGLRDNIEEVVALRPDYVGFLFYPKSLRFVGVDFQMPPIPQNVKKVGVFVNESKDSVLMTCRNYKLDFVQLHGSESPEDCQFYKKQGLGVIKAISIGDSSDFKETVQYQDAVDFFLFDTRTETYGGSGKKFDWKLLEDYSMEKPFFLSGGIDVESIGQIKKIKSPLLHAIDVNSRFEVRPGMKDVFLLDQLGVRIGKLNSKKQASNYK